MCGRCTRRETRLFSAEGRFELISCRRRAEGACGGLNVAFSAGPLSLLLALGSPACSISALARRVERLTCLAGKALPRVSTGFHMSVDR
jgi:hypothetical protein